MEENSQEPVTSPPGPGGGKSKLDTLSKDDLIKFAKKQMSLLQKVKSKCSDLEKEVEALKANPSKTDDSVIQALTEKMDVLLLEKAETQQSLFLLRKEKEKAKEQEEFTLEKVKSLEDQLDQTKREYMRKIEDLENAVNVYNAGHEEEVESLLKLIDQKAKEQGEEVQKLEAANKEKNDEIEQLNKIHQVKLSEYRKEIESLREEVEGMRQTHEEELREMTDQMEASVADFEMERERLLLLQDELTEQLAMKDSCYLQDVQEEEEEPSKTREVSALSHVVVSSGSNEVNDEVARFRLAFEDLQSQNTMLQEELTYLSNVKAELESDLQQVKDEFQHEREDLEFKINELQMYKEDSENMPPKSSETALISAEHWEMALAQHEQELHTLQERYNKDVAELKKTLLAKAEKEKEKSAQEIQELRESFNQLSLERNFAIEEYEKTKEILQNLESELRDRTGAFVMQYYAMKGQGTQATDQPQQKLDAAYLEGSMLDVANTVKLTLEESQEKAKTVQNLKVSMDGLQVKNEEIMTLLQQKEDALQELECAYTDMSARMKERQAEVEKVRNEYNIERENVTRLETSVENLAQGNKEMHNELKEVTEALAFSQAEKEKIENQIATLESQLAEVATEKENMASSLQLMSEEMARLKRKEETFQETIKAHLKDSKSNAEETQTLQEQLRFVSEERDALKEETAAQRVRLSHVWNHIVSLLNLDSEVAEDQDDIPSLVDRLLAQEKHRVLQESDAQIARLTQESERLREQSEGQEAELRNHLEDLTRERSMLRASMDEGTADMDALRRDLVEMKAVSEKVRIENQELLARVAELAGQLQAKESESERSKELLGESAAEKEDLQRVVTEKESLLLQLQQEIVLLKESKNCPALFGEDKLTQLNEKIADLQKENADKEQKMNKIKAVAVKAKKEADNSKKEVLALREEVENLKAERDRVSTSMKDIIQGAESYKTLLIEYDRLTEQLDQEKEKAEEWERQTGDLTKRLQAAILQHEQLTSETEDLVARLETLQNNVRMLETQAVEMQKLKCALEKDLEAEKLLKDQKAKDHLAAVKEVEELKTQLTKQKQQLQQTVQEVEQLRKEAQQNTLMDMEMAHYERLVKELNQTLAEKDGRIEELCSEIQAQKKAEEGLCEEIASLTSRVAHGEDKLSKMKQLLVKTKKDLSDSKQRETDQRSSQALLTGELEGAHQQLEGYKIQCSELTAETHRLQGQLRAAIEQQQRAAASFQHRLSAVQEDCSTAKVELAATTSEFESYKVRVHNVLKQQKSKSSAQGESDATRQERTHMENMLEQLRSRLQDTQQNLQQSSAELQQLQAEHDTLLERHNKILQESVAKEAELRERLLSLQSEHMALKSEHTQTVTQLSGQADMLRGSFREQVRRLQEEHRSTVETLQQQMSKLESQLFQLQKESSITSPAPTHQAKKPFQDRKAAELGLLDLQSMAREDGEGMETTETESMSSAGTPIPSLEQLLTSPEPKQEPFVWQAELSREELSQKLSTASRSMEHVSSLLHESEATNAVLMEQIALLKSEVRRLERNQEREKSVANLEYLKNVLLQFIFLKSGSEKQALLPVIHTMLQLSPEEKNRLAAIAQGDQELGAGSRGSGWTSYLHSWSGIR